MNVNAPTESIEFTLLGKYVPLSTKPSNNVKVKKIHQFSYIEFRVADQLPKLSP